MPLALCSLCLTFIVAVHARAGEARVVRIAADDLRGRIHAFWIGPACTLSNQRPRATHRHRDRACDLRARRPQGRNRTQVRVRNSVRHTGTAAEGRPDRLRPAGSDPPPAPIRSPHRRKPLNTPHEARPAPSTGPRALTSLVVAPAPNPAVAFPLTTHPGPPPTRWR